MDYKDGIEEYFTRLSSTLSELNIDAINRAMNAIMDAYNRSATIYIFGNGGSAATASHFCCDFNKGVCENLPRKFRFVCLNDNIPTILAIANDVSYDDIFLMQLEGKLSDDDLIIAISGSGNSKNVIKAVEYAKKVGAKVVGLSGYDGGKLKTLADYPMHVNSNDMQIVEDVHLAFNHMMMKVLRGVICGAVKLDDAFPKN